MNSKDYVDRLFKYEATCTPLVAESLDGARRHVESVGLAALAAPLERAIAVFCHVQAARELWLSRVSQLAGFPAGGVFPVLPLEAARSKAHELDELWLKFVAGLTCDSLAGKVRYESTEGDQYESALIDILIHVVNHSSYHRGQIAHLVAQTGTRPGVTDYIAFARTKV